MICKRMLFVAPLLVTWSCGQQAPTTNVKLPIEIPYLDKLPIVDAHTFNGFKTFYINVDRSLKDTLVECEDKLLKDGWKQINSYTVGKSTFTRRSADPNFRWAQLRILDGQHAVKDKNDYQASTGCLATVTFFYR
jgi:hypothetical protein